MTGNASTDDGLTHALASSVRADNGTESSAIPAVASYTSTSGDGEVEKFRERTQDQAVQSLASKQELDVQASTLPMQPEDQMSEELGPESEPEHFQENDPEMWEEVVEDEVNFASKLNTERLYSAYVNRLRKQDAETKREEEGGKKTDTPVKAPAMIRGVVDYVRVLEERIQGLEKAQDKPGEKVDVPETKAEGGDESGELIMEVKFFHADGEFDAFGNWQDNIHNKGSYQCVLDPKYLIRVLYKWTDGVQRKRSDIAEKPDPNDVELLAFGVESRPIANFFRQTLGFSTDKTGLMRFSKPFIPLIRSSALLRSHLEKLESKFGTDTVPIPVNPSDLAQVKEDSLPFASISKEELENETGFDTIEALAHFRCLFQFLDKYLANQISLHQRLRAGLEDKIAFENMWMLFQGGEKIYCPSHPGGSIKIHYSDEDHIIKPRYVPQLFQVLDASGGIPKRSTRASRQIEDEEGILATSLLSDFFFSMNRVSGLQQDSSTGKQAMPSKRRSKNKFSSLQVFCFHVDFDGIKYGTVQEVFIFKPHDGLVDIKSLSAFPIQYLGLEPVRDPGGGEGRGPESKRLVERGKKFIDVTALSHLSYEGLTVGKSREEINSAVIIDFNLSFQEYQNAFPDSRHVVPNFSTFGGFWYSPATDQESFITSQCDDNWCHKDDCTVDTYHGFTISYISKMEDRIKSLLDDYEPSIVLRDRGLQDFKQFMEENDLIILLPGVVPGFALRNRKWVQLNIDLLSELQHGDDWEKLVLPPGHREMVQAMVVTHTRGSQQPQLKDQVRQKKAEMDLVQGKGRGCIILLHGVPGVGKTSTAECVAANTRRPLYPITCGDIGYVPAEVEENMEEHFKLAHKWGCVLLLDEADVFLAKRNKADVKRNGLVSVFLRILEYYPGILFLTTNRVGAIDDAFRSRLHLTLYYPKLTKEQTRKIWKNNLSRLKVINRGREENNQESIRFDKKDILEWVKLNWQILQWNGRQIRNAFQTAIALAEFHATNDDAGMSWNSSRKSSKKGQTKGPSLDVSHFKVIANATLQFNEYLFETHGFDEDELAKRDKIRLSSHETTLKLKDVVQAVSSSSDDSESGVGSVESSSDESAKEAARKKAKRKEKKKEKKKSKAKTKSSKVQSSDSSGESDTGAKDKKSKTEKKAKEAQSEGSRDESDKGDIAQEE